MLKSLLKTLSAPSTQRAPMKGAKTPQVRNSAGGYTWAVGPLQRLDRFLILGSDSGTYYAGPKASLSDDLSAVEQALAADGPGAVAHIAGVCQSGRAPRNDAAILALAVALKKGDADTRKAAVEAVPVVCRTGTHLFQLASAVDALGGWGRGTKRAFAQWYGRDAGELAYQAVKYRQRDGWSHRDLLRKTHVRPRSVEHDALYGWICRGWAGPVSTEPPTEALLLPWAAERAQAAQSVGEIVHLVAEYGLPREALPTRWLKEPAVWETLLLAGRGMPMTAMLRNLATMTSVGLFERSSVALDAVCERLVDRQRLRRARVHPLAVLVALNTYRRGAGVRGGKTWTPVPRLLDALDAGFNSAFGVLESTGKKWMLAVDVSGSMTCGEVAGMTGITPRIGSAAMAMVAARTEPLYHLLGFSHKLVPLDISARMRLDDVTRTIGSVPMGGTDCALPMIHARKRKIEVDVFVVYTDNETWYGKVHPARALKDYRQAMGRDAKLIVVGMVSNQFTIADPDDPGMLDVVGFDTAAPALMRQFALS